MRDRGTGTVYFDQAKKRWIAKVQVGVTELGRPRYTKCSAATKREALQCLEDLVVARAKGQISTGKDQSFEQFAVHYYTHAGSQTIRATTRDGYLYILRHYAFPAIGKKQLRSITKTDLENLLYGLRKRYAAETVNQVRTLLKKLFSVALNEELIAKNPMTTIPKFKREPTDKTNKRIPPTVEEVRNMLDLARDTDLELFLNLLCSTGMRRGEALGLHWEDFNFNLGTVTINRTLCEGTKVARDGTSTTKPTYNPPKTAASRRTLRLAPPVLDLLHIHHINQNLQRVDAGEAWVHSDAVFTNAVGGEVWGSNYWKKFDQFLKRNGLRHIRIHDLRHGAVGILLEVGHPLEEITDLLGHSSIQITKDIYGGYAPALAQRAAIGMAKMLYPDVVMEETIDKVKRVKVSPAAPSWTPR